jgi:hypothetical protein
MANPDLDPNFVQFLVKSGIQHHIFALRGTKKESIPLPTLRAILQVLSDGQNQPILIHCNHGRVCLYMLIYVMDSTLAAGAAIQAFCSFPNL